MKFIVKRDARTPPPPDIDSSKVVWAREMDRADNLELMHYYADRKVWLVEPDTLPAVVAPYPVPGQSPAPALIHSSSVEN